MSNVSPVMFTPEIRRDIHGRKVVRKPAEAIPENPLLMSRGARKTDCGEGAEIPQRPRRQHGLAPERRYRPLRDVVV